MWHGNYRGYDIRSEPGDLRGDRQFFIDPFNLDGSCHYIYVASEEKARELIDRLIEEAETSHDE